MRTLSERQASACENAENPRCRCRCRGLLHGAKRGDVTQLPPSDPHYPAPRDEDEEGAPLGPPPPAGPRPMTGELLLGRGGRSNTTHHVREFRSKLLPGVRFQGPACRVLVAGFEVEDEGGTADCRICRQVAVGPNRDKLLRVRP